MHFTRMAEKEGTDCLKNSFLIDDKEVEVLVSNTKIIFQCKQDARPFKRCIAFQDVLRVHVLQSIMDGKGNKSASSQNPPSSALFLDYVRKHGVEDPKKAISHLPNSSNNFLWEPAKVILRCPATQYNLCQQMAERIMDYIKTNEKQRPKSLLVLINPVGGKKRGVSIYENSVRPIFQLGGVKTDVIITTHASHATEVLQTYDLSKVDGIVSVGGDGTFTQVINGLVLRMGREQGLNLDDVELYPPQLPLRIGIIPAGTGQGCIKMATGRFDPETAALHIVLGTEMDVNLMSIHNDGRLVHYGSMLCCYGFFGDTIQDSEANRGLGVLRYPVAILKNFIKFNKYELEIQMGTSKPKSPIAGTRQQEKENKVSSKQTLPEGYNVNGSSGAHSGSSTDQGGSGLPVEDGTGDGACAQPELGSQITEWQTVQGRFVMANVWLWDMAGVNCSQEESAVQRYVHSSQSWGNGSLHVQLVDSTAGRIKLMKHFRDFMAMNDHVMSPQFVKFYNCEAYRLTLVPSPTKEQKKKNRHSMSLSSSSEESSVHTEASSSGGLFRAVLNVDGDPFSLTHPCIEIRLRRRMLRMFGSGIDEDLFRNLKTSAKTK